MKRRNFLILSTLLILLLGLFVWPTWVTKSHALKRVGKVIGDCSFFHPLAAVGLPNYTGAFPERTWFGVLVSGKLICPPDDGVFVEYLVSSFGLVKRMSSK